jgi:hypothetical protein
VPFTPSHVAAILPFARTPLPPAALAIGAMVPDVFYYVPIDIPRGFTHSWLGVITVDLAFALLLFFLWEFVFRAPVIDFAPGWVRSRMSTRYRMPQSLKKFGIFAALLIGAVLIGATTHVLWDSLTHAGPVTDALKLDAMSGPLPLYKWGQHISTAAGVLALAVFTFFWWRRTEPRGSTATRLDAAQRRNGVLLVLASGLVVALVVWIRGIVRGWGALDSELVFYTVTIGLAAAALCAVIVSIIWWTVRKPRSH